ncbi:MAG TPA: hypothetical protein VLH08_16915, partial [Acidobacteriota bacterium]|nr:hypothetical protein [Acidobacteriota bacterium]
AIAHLWARAKVRDLEDQFRIDQNNQEQTKKQIIEISIHHTLLTRFTAFVVVDESEIVNQDGTRRKIVQPVEMPAQWEMEMDPAMPITGAFRLSTMAFPASPMPAGAEAPPSPMMQIADRQSPGSIVKKLLRKTVDGFQKQKPVNTKQLSRAIKDFTDAFSAVLKSIRAGNVPYANDLERTRKELSGLIKQTSEYPAVQHLLQVVEELLSLMRSPGIDMAALRGVVDDNQKVINEAFREVNEIVATPPFWESTI